MHRKPIDLKLPAKKEGGHSPFHFIAPFAAAVVLCALAALIVFPFFFSSSALRTPPAPSQGGIEIYVQPQQVYEGQEVKFKAYSSCGNFTVFADGKQSAGGVSGQEFSLALPAGNHSIAIWNADCNATAVVQVIRPACESGAAKACMAGGCAGTRNCIGGAWGDCELPASKCSPWEKIGCAYDSCSFGYSTCNKCGTAWGPCLPEGAAGNATTGGGQPCTGSVYC